MNYLVSERLRSLIERKKEDLKFVQSRVKELSDAIKELEFALGADDSAAAANLKLLKTKKLSREESTAMIRDWVKKNPGSPRSEVANALCKSLGRSFSGTVALVKSAEKTGIIRATRPRGSGRTAPYTLEVTDAKA